jgi:hypothetical protein
MMMDLLRFGSRQRVVIRLLTPQVWKLGVHWFGRTLLCPRPATRACPACVSDRGKWKGYAIGIVRLADTTTNTGLVEIPQTAVDGLEAEGVSLTDCGGVTFAMERRPAPRGWKVEGIARVESDLTPMDAVPLSLEVLYGLPSVVDDDGLIVLHTERNPWLAAHAVAIQRKLAHHCQKGSHQMAQDCVR